MLQSQSVAKSDCTFRILDLDKLKLMPLNTDPFEHVIVSAFIRSEWEDRLIADFPIIDKGGSFPLSTVRVGADFARMIDALNGPDFRVAVEKKFSINLEGRPTMFTVRGRCRNSDGKIHTDSESKLITVLLYINPDGNTTEDG